MNFKDMVNDVKRAAVALGNAAGTLENQNLADIIKSSAAKLDQAAGHPDVEKVSSEAVQGHVFGNEPAPFVPFEDPSKQGSG